LRKESIVSAAVSSKAVSMEAANQFYAFLSSSFAAEAMKRSGVDLPDGKP
jgi:ABC-type molybdate transport system substrate-binding protein